MLPLRCISFWLIYQKAIAYAYEMSKVRLTFAREIEQYIFNPNFRVILIIRDYGCC